MTREEAKILAPIIAAYGEGGVVELKLHGKPWEVVSSPCFIVGELYRIKPKPVECWMNEYFDGPGNPPCCVGYGYPTKQMAENEVRQGREPKPRRTVHMREVVE